MLGSLTERDETPEVNAPQSFDDDVVATPASAGSTKSLLARLSGLKTPKTEPRVDRGEMHPEHAHQTTTKAPDSGLKLGFIDISSHPQTIASAQNTPSKARTSTPAHFQSTSFDFKFGAESQLSSEAQQLMDNVREEAARIKAQMQAERDAQQEKDEKVDTEFNGINASGRKIAKPKGKAGRFSDVHMAQFKKMDSIANHPSAFRGKPSFAQPTTQSLKRSGSKAGLDENERPRTAGKGTPARRPPPPFLGRPTSVSPFKSIPSQSERIENTAPAKRARHSELHDVSASRPVEPPQPVRVLPKPKSSHLFSPTKASLARAATSQIPVSSPNKAPSLKRPASVKTLRTTSSTPSVRPATAHGGSSAQSPFKFPPVDKARLDRPLPPPPENGSSSSPSPESAKVVQSKPTIQGSSALKHPGFSSRLPKFSGLKSILRTGRKTDIMLSTQERQGTPKRPATATDGSGDVKKVDFTPSVKSRYAVKLAAGSPSPAKLPTQLTPGKALYDPAAYVLGDDEGDDNGDDAWEDAESEIDYPVLPAMSSSPAQPGSGKSFEKKAKDHNRRESKDFKSIFTTLHHPSRPTHPSNSASVNATVNKSGPTAHVNKIMRSPSNPNFSQPSPSTIRRVRTSGATELVQPFEDAEVQTVPHGIPGKKRRRESTNSNEGDEDSFESVGKENRRISIMPSVPGGWCDTPQPEEQDEGEKRGGKRAKVGGFTSSPEKGRTEIKKPRQSMAREMAKKTADARKGKGILSLTRLNMLSRPKQRG